MRSQRWVSGGAIFDPTGNYRYTLWREWDPQAPRLGFIMLNPSTADATWDDATIRRCVGFARVWGYGAVEVVNLFAYRTPHPRHLRQVREPIGPDNDRYLDAIQQRVQRLILAWGNSGNFQNRPQAVLRLLTPDQLYCLGMTRLGQPCHPLYLQAETLPIPFQEPGVRAGAGVELGDC